MPSCRLCWINGSNLRFLLVEIDFGFGRMASEEEEFLLAEFSKAIQRISGEEEFLLIQSQRQKHILITLIPFLFRYRILSYRWFKLSRICEQLGHLGLNGHFVGCDFGIEIYFFKAITDDMEIYSCIIILVSSRCSTTLITWT